MNEPQVSDIPEEVNLMEPVLRFLQLLCENHNRKLQCFLRHQDARTNYNMVAETLTFLDTICGSTKGSLGVFREITEHNVCLINQTLVALTEYCQGPCHENQNTIAMHESNGLDIIISLILNDIKPLADTHMELALEIKSNASKLLLAIMESRDDSENAERVLRNMSRMSGGPKQLVLAVTGVYKLMNSSELQRHRDLSRQRCEKIREACQAFYRAHVPDISVCDDTMKVNIFGDNSCSVDPKEVGHNIYILAHQLSRHSTELGDLLDPVNAKDELAREALNHYAKHTAQIEVVRNDRTLERIVFPVPQICEYLTDETRQSVYLNTERDEQGSKVTEFFSKIDPMFQEMRWQKKLRERKWLYQCTQRVQLWSKISCLFAFVINMLIALCYPFDKADYGVLVKMSRLICVCMGSTTLFAWTTPDSWIGLIALAVSSVASCILAFGPVPTLFLLGVSQPVKIAIFDRELWWLLSYLGFCLAGFLGHPLLYAILLFDLVLREDTLRNVIRSVTHNWRSIALTGMMALILVYCFSIIGYLCFQQDFFLEVDSPIRGLVPAETCSADEVSCELETTPSSSEEDKIPSCSTLRMCIVTTLNWGLRNGGGIGDILRKVPPEEDNFLWRIVYDMTFFVVLIIIVLNLIFGVIIDTFGDLRNEKQEKEHILKDTCFICGLERAKFDNRTVSFEEHIKSEHNLWHYLYFLVLLKVKDKTEFTGPESFVCGMVQNENLDWFPRMQAMFLTAGEDQNEQNEIKELHEQLKESHTALRELAMQINDLKQAVSRKQLLRGNKIDQLQLIDSVTAHFQAGDVAQRALNRS